MNTKVTNCIERVYVNKDYDYFKEMCKKQYKFVNELKLLTDSICEEMYIESLIDAPALEIRFTFLDYIQEEYCVHYQTILKISKLSDMFSVRHEFCVENMDPDRMTPVLDGFGGEPYTISQNRMEKEIGVFLKEKGLEKIELAELEEVLCELKMIFNSILGKQMTVEIALFYDPYGIND